MSKPFTRLIFIALVVSAAFIAGRWTAPVGSIESPDPAITFSTPVQSRALSIRPTHEKDNLLPKAPESSNVKSTSHSYVSDYAHMQALIALAATNPKLAMEQAQAFKGMIKTRAELAILEVWSGHDPDGAWVWVETFQPENTVRFMNLLEFIGRGEPQMAISYAEKFADSHREMRKDIYLSALTGVTQAGAYDAATGFLEHLDIEVGIKAELVNFVASAWAVYEPQAAMQWIMKQPQELRASASGRVSQVWADSDPQGATYFAATAAGADSGVVLQDSFSKWLATDSAAAKAWLAAAPNQQELDPLLSEVATMPVSGNGQVKMALSWAERISDIDLRLNTVTSILSAFKQQDSSTAATYLQDLAYLTDSQRTQLAENLAFNK